MSKFNICADSECDQKKCSNYGSTIKNSSKKSAFAAVCKDLVKVRDFQRKVVAQTNEDFIPVVGKDAGTKMNNQYIKMDTDQKGNMTAYLDPLFQKCIQIAIKTVGEEKTVHLDRTFHELMVRFFVLLVNFIVIVLGQTLEPVPIAKNFANRQFKQYGVDKTTVDSFLADFNTCKTTDCETTACSSLVTNTGGNAGVNDECSQLTQARDYQRSLTNKLMELFQSIVGPNFLATLYNKYQNLDKSRSGNITNYFPTLIANFEASARNKNGVTAANAVLRTFYNYIESTIFDFKKTFTYFAQ
ncbi:hypothetical protein WR25_22596 [Diploscapter pachys]|uniref:Uncharacterized protein n=1 Tax=Diploscapter pachys TaxID=2018661 RepID=A0A2A2JP48_9BILA|nr:hypothetical protein WR25_22596 [Diploscapter pachys]